MKKTNLVFALIIFLLLASCSGPTPAVTSELAVVSPIGQETGTPTLEPTPTPTPTLEIPVRAGTPYPTPELTINDFSSASVAELAQWGHGKFHSFNISQDGKLAAVCSSLGPGIYDADTLSLLRMLNGECWDIIFSPDSTLLAARGMNEAISVWSVNDGKFLFKKEFPLNFSAPGNLTSYFRFFDFSPDGKTLAILDQTHLYLFDAATGEQTKLVELPPEEQGDFLHYVNNQTLILLRDNQMSTIHGAAWLDIPSGKITHQADAQELTKVDFSADQNLMVMAFIDSKNEHKIQVFDTNSGALQTEIPEFMETRDMEFSPDSKLLAVSTFADEFQLEPQLCLWNMEDGQLKTCLTESITSGVSGVRFNRDGSLLTAYNSSGIFVWSTLTWRLADEVISTDQYLTNLFISAGGNLLAESLTGITSWNIVPAPLYTHTAPGEVNALAYSQDKDRLAVVGDWGAEVLDTATGQVQLTLNEGGKTAVFSDNNKILAIGYLDGSIGLYSLNNGSLIKKLDGLSQAATLITFLHKDAALLAGNSAEARLWKVSDGTALPAPEGDLAGLLVVKDGDKASADVSLENKYFAVEKNLTISLWENETGKAVGDSISVLQDKLQDITAARWEGNSLLVLTKDSLAAFNIQVLFPTWNYSSADIAPTLLATNSNGTSIILAGEQGALFLNEMGEAGRFIPGNFNAVAYLPSGKQAAFSSGNQVQGWEISAPSQLAAIDGFISSTSSYNLSYFQSGKKYDSSLPDQPVLLAGELNTSTKVIDLLTGEVTQELTRPDGVGFSVASADGAVKAFVKNSIEVYITNGTGEPISADWPDLHVCGGLRLSTDGKYLAGIIYPGSANPTYVGIWDTSNGKLLSHLNIVINGISNLQFSQDGKTLVLADGENVLIYNITRPAEPALTQTIQMRNASIAFSSDEKYLSVGGTDGTLTFLDVQNQWNSVFSFKAAEFGRIDNQLFLPDGKTLLTTGHDGAIHVWGVTHP